MQTDLTIALAQVTIATDPAVNLSKAKILTKQTALMPSDKNYHVY